MEKYGACATSGPAGGRNADGVACAGAGREIAALRGVACPASVTVAKPPAIAATQQSTCLCVIVPSYEKRRKEGSAFCRHSLSRVRPGTIGDPTAILPAQSSNRAVLKPINPISRLSVKVRDRYYDDQIFVDSVDQAVWEAG